MAIGKNIFELEDKEKTFPKALIKAHTFELICNNARIAIDKNDIFQDKIVGRKLMVDQRGRWEKSIIDKYLSEACEEMRTARKEFGAYFASGDYLWLCFLGCSLFSPPSVSWIACSETGGVSGKRISERINKHCSPKSSSFLRQH